jgi:hypothetical protein
MAEYNTPSINSQIPLNPLLRQPANVNAMQTTNFKLTFARMPNITFWCTSVNIPSITIGEVQVPTRSMPIHVPGSSVQLDQLRLTFMVDEDFANWREIYQWMRSIVPFEDFTEILNNQQDYYSEATIHCLSNAKNPNMRFIFKNVFPIAMDGFDLNSTLNEPEPVTISATLVYDSFDIETVT